MPPLRLTHAFVALALLAAACAPASTPAQPSAPTAEPPTVMPVAEAVPTAAVAPPPSTAGPAVVPTGAPGPTPDPTAVPDPTAMPPPRVGYLDGAPSPSYGVHVFLWGNPETTQRDLRLAKDAAFKFVKQRFE